MIGPKSFKRFAELCKNYIEAVSREAELRERDEIPEFETFKHLRRENSAVRLCYGLIEQALGIDLPDEVFENPVFKRMYLSAVDMVAWSNVSFANLRCYHCLHENFIGYIFV